MSTNRRDALRILGASASAILPARSWSAVAAQQSTEKSDQPGHVHEAPAVVAPHSSEPTFLQSDEFKMVEVLCERIIPRTDTPGAKDAGVALLIDKAIVAEPSIGPGFRAALADLNALASSNYNSPFVVLTEEQQIALLTPLCLDPTTPLGKFFTLAKDMTVTAYYKTEIGLQTELGWHGNTFLTDFPGCDHPEHHRS